MITNTYHSEQAHTAKMMIWLRLVEGMISSTSGGPPGAQDPGETDLPANLVSYFFMVLISVILGGILLIEQYFGECAN